MREQPYPPIGDYALIGDCRSAALVSRAGSVDWCCVPRMDRGSCFGRILDWDRGGHCSLRASDPDMHASRRYLPDTLVLETRYAGNTGEALVWDFFAIGSDGASPAGSTLVRIVECARGHVEFDLRVAARFDYGELAPWLRGHGATVFSLTGGDDALIACSDVDVTQAKHDLDGRFALHAGARARLWIESVASEALEQRIDARFDAARADQLLDRTVEWWRAWTQQCRVDGTHRNSIVRSAITLKALANPSTGAIAAAPTTSLPEAPAGSLNWDYRYSWIRDSTFSVHALGEAGFVDEADAFRRFIERSTAASANGLQIMYGIGGERSLTEITLDALEGYRGARPVRAGNAASKQLQLDVYGELVELAWRWHERGHSPDDDYWRFLLDVIDTAADNWPQPDRGIWEIRGEPRHFVHSKAMCWAALDRGIRLAEESLRQAPLDRWRTQRDRIRRRIERDGYDKRRGIFVQAFDTDALDAALLLLPAIGFVAWDDDRMRRTVDAIRDELEVGGLLLRYRPDRKLQGGAPAQEGTFLACSFWLAECLARQGRQDDARTIFDRAAACGNDLGLFAEEFDVEAGEMLGNFPQGLTHLAYISAASAMAAVERDMRVAT